MSYALCGELQRNALSQIATVKDIKLKAFTKAIYNREQPMI
jgi:hypothetical protein